MEEASRDAGVSGGDREAVCAMCVMELSLPGRLWGPDSGTAGGSPTALSCLLSPGSMTAQQESLRTTPTRGLWGLSGRVSLPTWASACPWEQGAPVHLKGMFVSLGGSVLPGGLGGP